MHKGEDVVAGIRTPQNLLTMGIIYAKNFSTAKKNF